MKQGYQDAHLVGVNKIQNVKNLKNLNRLLPFVFFTSKIFEQWDYHMFMHYLLNFCLT